MISKFKLFENKNYDYDYDFVKDLILDHPLADSGSFNTTYVREKNADGDIKTLKSYLANLGVDLDEFMKKYLHIIIEDASFNFCCGFLDYLIYTYDNSFMLSGEDIESADEKFHEILIKYYYGYHTLDLGKKYIYQNYDNMKDFFHDCAINFPPEFFEYYFYCDCNWAVDDMIKDHYEYENEGEFYVGYLNLRGLCESGFINTNFKDIDRCIDRQTKNWFVNSDGYLVEGFGDYNQKGNKLLDKYIDKMKMEVDSRKFNL